MAVDYLPYKSNYELSEARGQNVRFEIIEGLKDSDAWHNLEWLTLPSSDEPLTRSDGTLNEIIKGLPEEQKKAVIEKNMRVVIASVASIPEHLTTRQMRQMSVRPMSLIDYLYFSIYTITTTGYGDIIPVTAYTKFLTSLANICEVLFLVVFFNALISIKHDIGATEPNHPTSPKTNKSDNQEEEKQERSSPPRLREARKPTS